MNDQHKSLENQSGKKPASDSPPDSSTSSEATEVERIEVSAEALEKEGKKGQLVSLEASFSGPLPHPGMLQKYDDVLPGSAERIMSRAEANVTHFREGRKIGQYGGIVIACLAVLGASAVAFFSDSWYISLSAVLIAAVGVGGPTSAQSLVERFPKRSGSD